MSAVPQTPISRCIAILARTNDGHHLAPQHLNLVQAVCNSGSAPLTNAVGIVFDALYRGVMDDTYDHRTIWFLGIENLTRDHQGYIRWRGVNVECYSFPQDAHEREHAAAEALAARCRSLEARNVPVNAATVLFPLFAQVPAGSPFMPLLLRLYHVFTDANGRPACVIVNRADGSARALSFANGSLVGENFPGAYEAYHGCGITRGGGEMYLMENYDHFVAALEAAGFTPSVVAPLLA